MCYNRNLNLKIQDQIKGHAKTQFWNGSNGSMEIHSRDVKMVFSDVSIENPAFMCIDKTRDIHEFKSDIESFQRTPKIEEYNYQIFNSKHPTVCPGMVRSTIQMW
jgi:hypothetical protein